MPKILHDMGAIKLKPPKIPSVKLKGSPKAALRNKLMNMKLKKY